MNGVDGVCVVNKYILFVCGGGVYIYIFVYYVFMIFLDFFNELFMGLLFFKCLSFGLVIGCFLRYKYMYLGIIGVLIVG